MFESRNSFQAVYQKSLFCCFSGDSLTSNSLAFYSLTLCSSQISDIPPSIFKSSIGSPLTGRSVKLSLFIISFNTLRALVYVAFYSALLVVPSFLYIRPVRVPLAPR
jgi:hypothetical protein